MLSLIKYEFKGMYKSLISILVSIALIYILTTVKFGLFYGALNYTIAFALGVAVFVILIINCIKCFGKYLYDTDGYLMFTIPESGYSIVGSRLIVSAIQIVVVALAFALFIYFGLIVKSFGAIGLNEVIKINISPSVMLYTILDIILALSIFLLTIYFSMVLGKSIMPIKKYEKLTAFITYIVVNLLIGYIGGFFRDYIIINTPLSSSGMNMSSGNIFNIDVFNNMANLHLGQFIFYFIVAVSLFIGTAYLIDNKLEL